MKIGPPSSMGANLTAFIAETRSLGAYPVLVTPLSRRTFVNDTDVILDTLGPWANGLSPISSSSPFYPCSPCSSFLTRLLTLSPVDTNRDRARRVLNLHASCPSPRGVALVSGADRSRPDMDLQPVTDRLHASQPVWPAPLWVSALFTPLYLHFVLA